MNRFLSRCRWLALAGFVTLSSVSSYGQQSAADEATEEPGQPANSASQETDINEDNYRRFMELRDQSRQRPTAPYAVLAPPSNLEKMGQLPESSQKHLRNQLLGIILDGGRWEPDDAAKEYAFVPSDAAEVDSQLRSSEAAAWSELIQNYHARESEIYQAGARARSASVPAGAEGAAMMNGEESGAGSTTQADGSAGSERPGRAGSPGSKTSAELPRDAGATVNVLEYLTAGAQAGRPVSATGSGRPDGTGTAEASAASVHQQTGASDATATANEGEAPDSPTANQHPSNASGGTTDAASDAPKDPSAAPQEAASASASATERAAGSGSPAQQAQPEVEFVSEGVIAIRDLKKVKGTSSDKRKEEQDKDDKPK
jgi:hypothetical protein